MMMVITIMGILTIMMVIMMVKVMIKIAMMKTKHD